MSNILSSLNSSSLEALGAFVGGIAALLSLVYIAIQARQAEKNQRAQIQQARATRVAVTAMRMVEFNLSDKLGKCYECRLDVSEEDLRAFLPLCRANFVSAEDCFLQHQEGLLSGLAFESFEHALKATLKPPGFRIAWKITRDYYEPEFRGYMDRIVADMDSAPAMNRLALWKDAVAEASASNSGRAASPAS